MKHSLPERQAGRNEISEATHAVLDLLDEHEGEWADFCTWQNQLNNAVSRATAAANASETGTLAHIRELAVEGAARLIDAIGEIDRCINAGEQ